MTFFALAPDVYSLQHSLSRETVSVSAKILLLLCCILSPLSVPRLSCSSYHSFSSRTQVTVVRDQTTATVFSSLACSLTQSNFLLTFSFIMIMISYLYIVNLNAVSK